MQDQDKMQGNDKMKNQDIKVTELVELDNNRKWKYLKNYYKLASDFFNIKDVVVTDEEVENAIKNFKTLPDTKYRKIMKLKEWHFLHDAEKQGVKKGYFSNEMNESDWEKVHLPHSFNFIDKTPECVGKNYYWSFAQGEDQYSNIYCSHNHTWYKKRLAIKDLDENEVAYLNFENSNLITDVWVNGVPVMFDHLGPFPFEINVTEELAHNKNSEAVITARSKNIVSNIPTFFYNGFQFNYSCPPYSSGREEMDWLDQAWSGLAGDVDLIITNKNHFENTYIYTESISESKAKVNLKANLRNSTWKRFKGKLIVEIKEWLPVESKKTIKIEKEIQVFPMNFNEIDLNIAIEDPLVWNIDNPNLYIAHFILEDENGSPVDDIYESFGIRTIKINGNKFYLNGKKVVLRGTHDITLYHEESMLCPGDKAIVRDLLLHKKMFANCSRYPSDTRIHYTKIAKFADQLGYMLSWTGYFEVWLPHPEMEVYANRDIVSMVRSLRNHPSIIIWEMGDEVLQDTQDYRRFRWYEKVQELVSGEDKSRPILPTGWYSNDLVTQILKNKKPELSYAQTRKEILEDFPGFALPNSYWDIHYCPMVPPVRPNYMIINEAKNTLEGEKATIFTEFGIDGMPDWQKVLDVYGKFRWSANPLWMFNREQDDINYYGRKLTEDDWKETQACQAIVLSNLIGYLREYPDIFAGYFFITIFDAWTYYWGVADIKGNCKLAYFLIQNIYQPVYISGLHGNTCIKNSEKIKIIVSNYDEKITDADLEIIIRDEHQNAVIKKDFNGLMIDGDVKNTTAGCVDVNILGKGLYSIEYYLRDKKNNLIAKMLELFFIE